MGLMANTLKNRRLMTALGFILLIALIVVVGRWRNWPTTEIVLGVVVILFAWIILLMYERMQSIRSAGFIEQSIRAQADDQIQGMRPEKREEIERFKQELTGAIESLKKSKLGRGRTGRAALYALPWYMMIGPPGSGKSTAIKNSGLEFPFGADKEIRGVGGTRNCEWFFSNSAILLDTAGRFVTEDDDREEWLAFLDTLKKHRRKMPINGVLVGMSISDLLESTPEEIERHAQKIRQRIDELMQRLGVRYPVYLVFTKCDLLDGFVEFFEAFNRREREQVWGCTFAQEQMDSANARGVFEKEFEALLEAAMDLRLARLNSPLKREQRRKVYLFPLQLAAIKDKINDFAGNLFRTNRFQDNPIFRGFYFTSGTQEGAPLDRAIEAISREFGLPPTPPDYFGADTEIRHYFIKDLLAEVVIPDQNLLVGTTSRAATTKRLARLAIMAGAAVLLALFILGVSNDYLSSKAEMTSLQKAASSFSGVNYGGPDRAHYFEKMQDLRSEILSLESRSFFRFGMGRRREVLKPAYQLYFAKVSPFIREALFLEMAKRLKSASSDQSQDSRGVATDYLKAYLLLSSERRKLFENSDHRAFLEETTKLLELDSFMKDEIAFFLKRYANPDLEGLTPSFPEDQNLIARVRDYVKSMPINEERRTYESLKRKVTGIHPVSFVEPPLRSSYEIPDVFTLQGWEKLKQSMKEKKEDDGREDWVLGIAEPQALNHAKDAKDLGPIIQTMYFEEYASQWWQFLRGMQYTSYSSLGEAAEQLKKLGEGEDSPLMKLLLKVTEQTRFDYRLPTILGKKLPASAERLINSNGADNPVDTQFGALYELVKGNNREDLNVLLNYFMAVSAELEALAQDQMGVKAKEFAAQSLSGSGALPQALKDMRKLINKQKGNTHEVLSALFEPPIKHSWGFVLNETQGYLNEQWRQQVCGPYSQKLAGYYPFDKSGPDAPLDDVAWFFGLQSPFEEFVKSELQPFVRMDNSWQPILWEGQGIQISSTAQKAFRQIRNLSAALSQGSSIEVTFDLLAHPPIKRKITSKPPEFKAICLTIGVEESAERCYEYERPEKPKPIKYVWPGQDAGRGASLTLLKDSSILGLFRKKTKPVAEKSHAGIWGWFRLLDQSAKRIPKTPTQYEYQWNFGEDKGYEIVVSYSLSARSTNNPFVPGFFSFNCPGQLN